jgi:hypothetical protein
VDGPGSHPIEPAYLAADTGRHGETPSVGSGSGTFLFHIVIRAVSVRFFADRSALSICGFVSWERLLKSIVSAGAAAVR